MLAVLAVLSTVAAACGSSAPAASGGTPAGTALPQFVAAAAGIPRPVWLCHPGMAHDPCTSDLATTVLPAHGSPTVVRTGLAGHPPVDCFYVYPTVSTQTTGNANLSVDPEETAIAQAQASRFSTVCRVFAPMYRQLTLSAIGGGHTSPAPSLSEAYSGVLDAWKYYLAHDNHGRGVVFIGHSQGASMLIRLLSSQVDPNPAERHLLVSAILAGGNVTVPVGKRVGGSFAHLPSCNSATETGCIVAYSSFDQPPPTNSLFGRVGTGVSGLSGPGDGTTPASDLQVLCVNPASIAHPTRPGLLLPYAPTARFPGPLGLAEGTPPRASTPWVSEPDLYTSRCVQHGGASWLQVDTTGIPGDHRPVVRQVLGPAWGLHLDDINLALGNLVALVHDQAGAYTRA